MSAEIVSLATASEAKKNTTLVQDFLKVLIPSLVTALFGFLIWNAQNEIQKTVARNNQMLQTQMALKEEFYKRRLTRYEAACQNVASVKYALDVAQVSPGNETKAMNKLAELNEFKTGNVLYWSDGLNKRLGALWTLGIEKIRTKQFADKTTNENISSEISALHKQMKEDLAVEEMSMFLQPEKRSK
jgi:hypothetical protein